MDVSSGFRVGSTASAFSRQGRRDHEQLSNLGIWADIGAPPDGRPLDAKGCVWAAIPQIGRYVTVGRQAHVREGGEVANMVGIGQSGVKNGVLACQLGTDAKGKHQLFFLEAFTCDHHAVFKDGREHGPAQVHGVHPSFLRLDQDQPFSITIPPSASQDSLKTEMEPAFVKTAIPTVIMFPGKWLWYWFTRRYNLLVTDWETDQKPSKKTKDRIATLLCDGFIYGEGPRFRTLEQALYFTDMYGKQIFKYDLNSKKKTLVYEDQDDFLSGLGWLPDERLVVTSMNSQKLLVLDKDYKNAETYADVAHVTAFRVNDLVVDVSGRVYLGNFGFDFTDFASCASTTLVSVDNDAEKSVSVQSNDLLFPNGMVITPDGKTLIVAETFRSLLTAFDIAKDGSLSNRRVWADIGVPPDGICLDAEGCVWAAIPQVGGYITVGGCVRVREGGEILNIVGFGQNGVKNGVFACQLGTDTQGKHQLFFLEAFTNNHHSVFKDGPEAARRNGQLKCIEVSVGPALHPTNANYCGGYC